MNKIQIYKKFNTNGIFTYYTVKMHDYMNIDLYWLQCVISSQLRREI
jgi:hypothetical protein